MSSKISLWPHQLEARHAVKAAWGQGKKSVLISIPTGGGKTIIFSSIGRDQLETRPDGIGLILAHRDSLLQQAKEKLHYVWPEVPVSMVAGGKYNFTGKFIIASVATVINHLDKLPKIDLIITDEAHHAYAGTYRKIYDHIFQANPDCRHLGVTATPLRTNKKESLTEVFDDIAHSVSIFRLIMEGYLAPLDGYAIETSLDLTGVRTRGGDYEVNDLAKAVAKGDFNEVVVSKVIERARDRKSVCFAVNVAHVEQLTRLFNARGIRACGLHGKLPKGEQTKMLKDFIDNRYQVLVNCMIATEGFDDPPTDCVIMARPTKSIALYTQMVGRGLRLSPGKKNCLLLDFVDNHDGAGLVSLKDLLSFYDMKASAELLKDYSTHDRPLSLDAKSIRSMAAMENMGKDATSSGALTKLNIFDVNDYAWAQFDGNYYVSLRMDVSLALIRMAQPGDAPAFTPYIVQGSRENAWYAKLSDGAISYDFALAICNIYLFDYGNRMLAQENNRWRQGQPSDAQLGLFEKMWTMYQRMVPRTTLRREQFLAKGPVSDLITAAKTLLTLRNGTDIGKDQALEALRLRVARELSIIPFDTFEKLPWDTQYIPIATPVDHDSLVKLKQMSAYLKSAYADPSAHSFVIRGEVSVEDGKTIIKRKDYPASTLNQKQYGRIYSQIYPVFKMLFPQDALEIVP